MTNKLLTTILGIGLTMGSLNVFGQEKSDEKYYLISTHYENGKQIWFALPEDKSIPESFKDATKDSLIITRTDYIHLLDTLPKNPHEFWIRGKEVNPKTKLRVLEFYINEYPKGDKYLVGRVKEE